ncbi:MAG: DUF1800 family protein [Opitutaceae bacterium]
MKRPIYLSLITAASLLVLDAVDSNSNGLSDVWEQRFSASDLLLDEDEDGDGFSNFEECIAGTDPKDGKAHPALLPLMQQTNADTVFLNFSTLQGKRYRLYHSSDLESFAPINNGWVGDGSLHELSIQTDGVAEILSPITIQFWASVVGDSIEGLEANAEYPLAPDGSLNHHQVEAPIFRATSYGAKISLWLTPPETGTYTFFISAGGPAELRMSQALSSGDLDLEKIAEVLPAQIGIEPEEWDAFATQRSAPIDLIAGERYAVEIPYFASVPKQHVQIAWSGTGIEGIQAINKSNLAKAFFHNTTAAAGTLLEHDYDSAGQTAMLWPNNTELVTGTVNMTGNAEHIFGDVGSQTEERLEFPATNQHLYATWLFNMGAGAQDTYLFWLNANEASAQEGPRIDIEDSTNATLAVVRAGGSNGSSAQVDIEFDKTFRIEMVTTLSEDGYEYKTPTGSFFVPKDTFDIYVSEPSGNLIGSATGLTYRDGANVVTEFSGLRIPYPNSPNITFDDWEITNGAIKGSGYLVPNTVDFGNGEQPNFFELKIQEIDQDNDGLPDWEELALAEHYELLFFDAQTNDGTPDNIALEAVLTSAQGVPDFMLYGSDVCAIENNYPNTIPDNGEITITREGELTPLTITLEIIPLENTGDTNTVCDGTCCMLVGTAGDEAAEVEDYQLIDEDGTIVTDTVHFDFGETQKVLTVVATKDSINEYPETLNLRIAAPTDGSYTTSELMNGASIQLFDLPDSPDNLTIFTGSFSKDGRAMGEVNGSGSVTATINGPRNEIRIWNQFSNLTSPQQDAHVHKSSASNGAGDIVYAITNTPSGESGPAPGSDPFNGQLDYYPVQVLSGAPIPDGVEVGDGYPWDLSESAGVVPTGGAIPTKQAIIDSLFGQNGESPLYLNIHTVNNAAGEIWAFLELSEGSINEPEPPESAATPGSVEYPQLSGELLEAEVRRFLNQATFGATDASVASLLETINTERASDPSYHRNAAYAAWIDKQIDPAQTQQTYLLDYMTAGYMQYLHIAGVFDPAKNPTDGETLTPTAPATWPAINRDDPNSELWYLDQVFPLTRSEYQLADDSNDLINSGGYRNLNRTVFNQLMINAKDQLRQKMGFSLQQIVVISKSLNTVRDQPFANANYQDQLNAKAFGHYRDVLGYVNWSPLMGAWLSSLKNQKAIDFDGDGLFDSYPDENLARENMQLFSIGLFNIWPDGSLRLTPNGLPEPSYTNADIQEFAKILTGQSFSLTRNRDNDYIWGGSSYAPDNENFAENDIDGPNSRQFLYPMKMFGDYHSLGAKTFAGTTIDNTALTDFSQQGIADIEAAIDWLAGKPGDGLPDFDMVNSHVSTPSFIARRLIQRFTTSNPSTEYLHRVATAFKDSEGNLGLTVKAILLDPEARILELDETRFGLKKSPMEGYFQLLRALGAHSYIPLQDPAGQSPYDEAPGSYTNSDLYISNFGYPTDQLNNHERNVRILLNNFVTSNSEGLQMNPFDQETVFNYYLPDFSPGGAIGAAGMVAPEIQLANEPDIIRNINYFEQIARSSNGQGGMNLGNSTETQRELFNSLDVDGNDSTRLPLQALANSFYPASPPDNTNDPFGRTSESLADEAMLNELDLRLTNGLFKIRYPYDPTDDDDPNNPGVDDLLKNPRELIIDSVLGVYGDPYNGSSDDSNRRDKLENMLFLLTFSPEYQVKK